MCLSIPHRKPGADIGFWRLVHVMRIRAFKDSIRRVLSRSVLKVFPLMEIFPYGHEVEAGVVWDVPLDYDEDFS